MLRVFLVLSCLVVAAPAALLALALDRAPVVSERARLGLVSTDAADRLWRRYDPRHMPTDHPTLVEANETQLNRALQAALATLPGAAGRAEVTPGGLEITLSGLLPLPENPFGRYLNLHIALAPAAEGFAIGRFAIGQIEVPRGLVRPAAEEALDWMVAPGRGSEMLNSVRSLDVEGDRVAVLFQPPRGLKSDIARAARKTLDGLPPERVRPYYAVLVEALRRSGPRRVSLTMHLQPVFRLAAERSGRNDPILENRAAILALAMTFGDRRFERMSGRVRTGDLAGPMPDVEHVRLAGRRDFVQHFTVSAGLAAFAGNGFADAIGLGKEFRDALRTSGFSFTDLAADRAGVRFATLATESGASARSLQRRVASSVTEADMFPETRDLPEGLSEAEFRRRFGDTTSAAYTRQAAEIERRIGLLPIYR